MTKMSTFLEGLYPGHPPCLTRLSSLNSGQRIHSLDQEFSVNVPFRPGTQATSINHLPSGAQPALLHHAVKPCFPHRGLLPTLGEMEFPVRASGVSTKMQLGLLKRISGQSIDKQNHWERGGESGVGIRTLTTQTDPRVTSSGSQPVGLHPPTVAYQTFTLQFIDSSEITVMKYQRNDFMVGGHTTWGTVLKGRGIREVENLSTI